MDKKEMKSVLKAVDYDLAAEKMAEFLTDPEIGTYDMFEDLVCAYTAENTSDEYRAGMDKVLTILTWKSMEEIAQQMKDCAVSA